MMDTTITVRPAQVKDAESIAFVQIATWRTAYKNIIDAEYLDSLLVHQRSDYWHSRLEAPAEAVIMVATNSFGEVIGFASAGPNHAESSPYAGEIYGLYVLDPYQRQGIGRRLVQAVVRLLRARDMNSLVIWVFKANPAREFYAKLGGRPVQEREIEIGRQHLTEVAYGWPNTASLAVL